MSIKDTAKEYGYDSKEYDLSREVKKITKYTPKNVDGVGFVEKTTEYLPRPFRADRQLNHSEQEKLPLKNTSCCKWIGLTDIPVGAWPDKIRDPLGWYDGYVYSDKVPTSLKGKLDVSRYSLVEGSWGTNKSLLEEMGAPPAVKSMPSAYELIQYSMDRLHKFGLPEVDFVLPKWILNAVTMNSEAHPGIYSRTELGTTKETAYSKAILIARKLWDKIVTSRSPICDTSLWAVGGRARKQDFSKGKPPESRIVLMPETPNAIIAGAIAQPVTRALKKSLLLNPDSECFMGQDTTNGGWRRIRNFVMPGTPVLELDWKKFDSTVIENAMVAAFCILRSCFPESAKLDKIFLFVMSGFIYKNVAIKQRFIYRLTRGIPSGSPLTSIMNTLVNWICLNYTLRKHKMFGISGPDDYKLGVAGDDTLIAFLNGDKHELEDGKRVSRLFKESVNLRVEPEDLNYNYWYGGESYLHDGRDAEYAPSLLKTTIWHGIPGRRLDDLVKSITCPESVIRSYWDVLEVIKGYTSIPVFTPLGRAFLKSVSLFVASKLSAMVGLDEYSEVYHAFSGSTYLPICESLVRFEDLTEAMMRDPPYLSKNKWKGRPAAGWAADLADRVNLAYFGVPDI